MLGLDLLATKDRPSSASAPDRVGVRGGAVASLTVAGVGAAVASRMPLVGSLAGIIAGTLAPSPTRAILGAVAAAVFPPLAIPICGFELWTIANHLQRNPGAAVATVLGLAPGRSA